MARDRRAGAVARRAVDLAASRGVDLPDHLAIWALAGGRPAPSGTERAAPGTPDDLGALLEGTLDPDERARHGAHYTPPATASELVAAALAGRSPAAVCDPSCGGGAILLAVARHLAGRGEAPARVVQRLWGADIDPLAVATTEVSLAIWAGVAPPAGRLRVTDVLLDPPDWPSFDAVIGNPPFQSQLGRATARTDDQRRTLRTRFGDGLQAYTDSAGLFLLAACGWVRPGGVVALLQPQSVLGARDAAGVRRSLARRSRLREVWVPAAQEFAARVSVCAPILEVGDAAPGDPAGDEAAEWAVHLARSLGIPTVDLDGAGRVGDLGPCVAGFRDEYYGLVDGVAERVDAPDGAPLVTSGLIDLGSCAWGHRPARVAGQRWAAPVVDPSRLSGRGAAWVERTRGPKVVVATQTRVVEAAVDESGTWVPGVPLIAVLPRPADLWAAAAALCAPPVSAWVAQRTAGTGLASGSLKLSVGVVREVPLPAGVEAWRRGADALRRGRLAEFGEAMCEAYGTDAEVLTWWHARLPGS